jgi:hypothetical protein
VENSRGLEVSDPTEGARRLWCVFSKCKSQENRAVGSGPTGPSDHSHILHLGFREVKGRNLCSETHESVKGEVPR